MNSGTDGSPPTNPPNPQHVRGHRSIADIDIASTSGNVNFRTDTASRSSCWRAMLQFLPAKLGSSQWLAQAEQPLPLRRSRLVADLRQAIALSSLLGRVLPQLEGEPPLPLPSTSQSGLSAFSRASRSKPTLRKVHTPCVSVPSPSRSLTALSLTHTHTHTHTLLHSLPSTANNTKSV